MMQMNNPNSERAGDTKALIVVAVLAFIVGFGAAWLWQSGSPSLGGSAPGETGKEADAGDNQEVSEGEDGSGLDLDNVDLGAGAAGGLSAIGNSSVSVSDQAPGRRTSVDSVAFVSEGWVAIHEDREGEPGNILGAAWFPEGSHSNVMVELLRGTVEGGIYYAVLWSDDGDHEFELDEDTRLRDSSGNLVMMRFETSSSPSN